MSIHKLASARSRAHFFVTVAALIWAALLTTPASAAIIALDHDNSHVVFHTQASDLGTLGMNSWEVDGIDHMAQQWFWYRVGSQSREHRIDGTGPLMHVSSTAVDTDGDAQVDFLLARYADTEIVQTPETFRVDLRFGLTGGTTASGRSDVTEVIRVENIGATNMDLHLFQYVDFDLNQNADDDSLVITGSPPNTARQTDLLGVVGETVATPAPSHYEANHYPNIIGKLDDALADSLNDNAGPIFGDATWAFQWDFSGLNAIAPRGSRLISKDKSIHPGQVIPEPSSFILVGLAGVSLLCAMRRRSR